MSLMVDVEYHQSVIYGGVSKMEPLKDIECDKCSFKLKVGIYTHGVIWCPMCRNVLVDGYLYDDEDEE